MLQHKFFGEGWWGSLPAWLEEGIHYTVLVSREITLAINFQFIVRLHRFLC